MKVTVIGNSVALRVRPPLSYPNNRNYTYQLKNLVAKSVQVENIAIGATTVNNWISKTDSVINHFADIYIIHIGVVDATIREVPLWYYRLATKKVENYFTRFLRALYRGPIAKARPLLCRLRGSRSWVSAKKFRSNYEKLVKTILKDTNAQIIAIPINLADDRIENILPGSRENHKKYNRLIEEIIKKYDQVLLDINDLKSENHYPDGVHYNSEGHTIIAKRLAENINKMM